MLPCVPKSATSSGLVPVPCGHQYHFMSTFSLCVSAVCCTFHTDLVSSLDALRGAHLHLVDKTAKLWEANHSCSGFPLYQDSGALTASMLPVSVQTPTTVIPVTKHSEWWGISGTSLWRRHYFYSQEGKMNSLVPRPLNCLRNWGLGVCPTNYCQCSWPLQTWKGSSKVNG